SLPAKSITTVVFFSPGQKIKFIVTKKRNGKAEGRLLEVIEKSPMETGRTCSLFGICGGCNYLSLSYDDELELKKDQVKTLLDNVPGIDKNPYVFEGIKGSPVVYGYRNKMEFSFGDSVKGGELELGMHKRGSFYDVVSVTDCMIVDEDYRLILKTVRDYFRSLNMSYFHRMDHKGFLRHLLVRKASKTGEILIALVTTSQYFDRDGKEFDVNKVTEGFKEELLKLSSENRFKGSIEGILHIFNDSVSDVVKADRTEVLFGRDHFYEELLGLRFRISPFSFFQTNSYSAEVLYKTVGEYVGDTGKDKTVFDLYSGTGTIAQLVSHTAGKVVGVEIVEEAVKAAREAAKGNGIENCEFIAGDVLKVLDEIEDKPDVIILDPPRDGIHPKALPKILSYGVERIVYVSCNPTTFVRDMTSFFDMGYTLKKAVCVDQFPWTANTEVCSVFEKK
nr:23S rRNA (uracil(1939)-C(5))-methyltransferase RlmD [Lachnospiraceae bacterium]